MNSRLTVTGSFFLKRSSDFYFYLFLSFLSGILLATSFIPFYPWAIFFAWIPCWWSLFYSRTIFQKIFLIVLQQFVFHFISCHWLFQTSQKFFDTGFISSSLILLAFSLFAGYHYWLATFTFHFAKKKLNSPNVILVLPILFSLSEILLPRIFPWNLGHTWLYADWSSYLIAREIGFSGISLIILVINGLLLLFLLNRRFFLAFVSFIFCLSLLAMSNSFFSKNQSISNTKKLRILAVQANISNSTKSLSERGQLFEKKKISDQYIQMTFQGLKKYGPVDFIIWPETASPTPLNFGENTNYFHKRLLKFVKKIKTPLITGAYFQRTNDSILQNALFFIHPNGTKKHYSKQILFPFGEYIPGSQHFPFLKGLFSSFMEFESGSTSPMIFFKDLLWGPQICYEGIFSQKNRSSADILINVTNDSWFDSFFEPKQHLYLNLASAIEQKKPLIRVSNNGHSIALDHTGRLLSKTPLNQKAIQYWEIPLKQ